MSNLDKAKDFFKDDIFSTQTTGIEIIEVGDKYAKCFLKIDERHLNATNRVMGGAIFTLADFTYAVASNFNQIPNVTRTTEISFLGQPAGNSLISESKLIKDGQTTCTYEISIKDEFGTPVAIAISNGVKLDK